MSDPPRNPKRPRSPAADVVELLDDSPAPKPAARAPPPPPRVPPPPAPPRAVSTVSANFPGQGQRLSGRWD